MKFSNVFYTRLDSVKNLIQNDSVSPVRGSPSGKWRKGAIPGDLARSPPITVWFCDHLAAASVLGS